MQTILILLVFNLIITINVKAEKITNNGNSNSGSDLSGDIKFPQRDGLGISNFEPTTSTTAPDLSVENIANVTSIHDIVTNGISSDIDSTGDLPEIISVGVDNTSGTITATTDQVSITISETTSAGVTGTSIIAAADIPPYPISQDASVTQVLPSIVSVETTAHQTISSVPINGTIIPGQRMIVSVEQTTLKSYGGILKLDVQSSSSATTTGTVDQEWFVIETSPTIITGPNLSDSGFDNELLFV